MSRELARAQDEDRLLLEVLQGLNSTPKTLPSKLFYDQRGSELFDKICLLPEYYPTRTETAILSDHAPEIARALGPGCSLIEYGAGNLVKARILLDQLVTPRSYIPVDISGAFLAEAVRRLTHWYPYLKITPVIADFLAPFPLPGTLGPRRVVFFSGSTIGNFEPLAAIRLLSQAAMHAGRDGSVLIGVDLVKDIEILEAAYNDSSGTTSAFNLNMLEHCNHELGCEFDLRDFRHEAFFNPTESRIEMHLRCLRSQVLDIGGEAVVFERGERIRTEYSYKYTVARFRDLARQAGLSTLKTWVDEREWFSVHLLAPYQTW